MDSIDITSEFFRAPFSSLDISSVDRASHSEYVPISRGGCASTRTYLTALAIKLCEQQYYTFFLFDLISHFNVNKYVQFFIVVDVIL